MNSYLNEIKDVFPEGSEEYDIIKEVYGLITQSSPSISAEAKTHLILLDHSKVKLSTLYFMVRRNIARLKESEEYKRYDAQYTRLVKLGRPSKDAIESEIRVTNPEYVTISHKLNSLYDIQELITLYIKCVDTSRMTATELLRNINRVD